MNEWTLALKHTANAHEALVNFDIAGALEDLVAAAELLRAIPADAFFPYECGYCGQVLCTCVVPAAASPTEEPVRASVVR